MLKEEFGFDEFEDVSLQAWKEVVAHENGGGFPDDLNWKVGYGVEVPSFHHRGLRSRLVYNNADLLFNHTVCHSILWEKNDNKKILENLSNGADGVILKANEKFEFEEVLAGVHPDCCHLCFSATDIVAFHAQYHDWLVKQQVNIKQVNGLLLPDLNNASEFQDYNQVQEEYEKLLSGANRVVGVKSIPLHIAGMGFQALSPEQELGLLCAQMVDRIHVLADNGYKLHEIVAQLFLYISLGDVFFLEIAKIKSMKLLTVLVLGQYNDLSKSMCLPIMVNIRPKKGKEMISNTVQVTAALLGGADFIGSNSDVPEGAHKRIARNVTNILKEESYMGKTDNPLQGAYFLEDLLDKLVRQSWGFFLKIQRAGGYRVVLKEKDFFDQI